jgi:hypothetical protein
MLSNKTMHRHADLVDRMAGALGMDLQEAVMRGHLSMDELPDMVLRCTGCANPDGCTAFLEQTEARPDAGHAATTPYYCRNAGVFDDLGRR